MDPLTALGLAVNVLTLIELGAKILKGAKDVRATSSGVTEENRTRELLVKDMSALSDRLIVPEDSTLSQEEKELCKLAQESRAISGQLLELLGKIQAKAPKSKTDSLWSVLKDRYYEGDKQALEQRLDRCRSQMHFQLSFWTRSNSPPPCLITRRHRSLSNISCRQDVHRKMTELLKFAHADSSRLQAVQEQVAQVQRAVATVSYSAVAQHNLHGVLDIKDAVFTAIYQHRVLEMLSFSDMHGRYEMVDVAHQKTFHWIFDNKRELREVTSCGDHNSEHDSDRNSDHDSGRDSEYSSDRDSDDDVPEDKDSYTTNAAALGNQSLNADSNGVKREARERLQNWLVTGDGIFHISGKLGSGKSTLMKFLLTRHGTRAKLQQWAGKTN
jgi:hypothetical protein